MANPFVHIELNTSDLNKARGFYGELLDWELKDVDMGPGGTYTTISVGEGTGGGMMKHPMEGAPSLWIPYILVKDIAATTAKARKLGANVIKENVPVSNMGAFSIITDPTGATFALWEERK
ncbi:MAG: VOC family protein [Proteobacteria bacterium]|nr:VOC family protein [Pseudomonadota bacterium]